MNVIPMHIHVHPSKAVSSSSWCFHGPNGFQRPQHGRTICRGDNSLARARRPPCTWHGTPEWGIIRLGFLEKVGCLEIVWKMIGICVFVLFPKDFPFNTCYYLHISCEIFFKKLTWEKILQSAILAAQVFFHLGSGGGLTSISGQLLEVHEIPQKLTGASDRKWGNDP